MALPSRVQAPSALPAAEDAQAWPLISAPPAPPDSILDLSPSAMATARSLAEVVVEGDSTLTFDYEQNWIAKPAPRPSGRFCDYCQAPTRAPPARTTARPPACTRAHAHERSPSRHAASERASACACRRAGGRASERVGVHIHSPTCTSTHSSRASCPGCRAGWGPACSLSSLPSLGSRSRMLVLTCISHAGVDPRARLCSHLPATAQERSGPGQRVARDWRCSSPRAGPGAKRAQGATRSIRREQW